MPEVLLYAELLIHIRQLTLYASLETEKNEHTKILVSSDKKIVTAFHDGEAASIYLPTQISGTADITFPLKRRTDLSTKLQIEDLHELEKAIEAAAGIEVPWAAGDLADVDSIACKSCDEAVVKSGAIGNWKDLPSENWADLMDLWFCHKPHEENHEADTADRANQAPSNSRLDVSPGTGLVDTSSLLLHPDDCNELQVVSTENIKLRTLTCGNCNYFLGSQSESQEGNRLWKSRLKITTPSTSKPTSFDSSIFIAAQLLQLVESSISRRVIVHADDSSPGLLTWIFNPDIYYSSSKRGPTVHRAMKIFYQTIPDPISLLETVLNTHEELVLPAPELDELKSTLEASTNILPQSAQTFQDWRVGLLDRYETRPSGMGAMDQNALNHPAPESIQLFKSHLPEGWQELYL